MHTPWGARPLCDLQEGSAVPVRSHISSPFPFSSGTGADESSELVASTFVYGRHSRAQSWALQFLGNVRRDSRQVRGSVSGPPRKTAQEIASGQQRWGQRGTRAPDKSLPCPQAQLDSCLYRQEHSPFKESVTPS